MQESEVVEEMLKELARARMQHPIWPIDPLYGVAIMVEEAGEAMRAALNCFFEGVGTIEELRKELIQTGAMCIRAIVNLSCIGE